MNLDRLRARIALDEVKLRLERKLRSARFKIPAPDRERFARARFDYAGRRLVGDSAYLLEDGTVCLMTR